MNPRFLDGRVEVKTGDITQERTDAIVNAANSSLLGGGGVDGAIHRAGGPRVLEACTRIRQTSHPDGLPAGQAVITTGGSLKARWVVHTVGPVWHGGHRGEPEALRDCYLNSLSVAAEHGCSTVAFPAISTGVYGYPKDQAARVASQAIKDFLGRDARVAKVTLVFFSSEDAEVFVASQAF